MLFNAVIFAYHVWRNVC